MSEDNNLSASKKSNNSNYKPFLIVIAVLLTLIFIAQIYTIVDIRQQRQLATERATQMAEVAASIQQLNSLQDELSGNLFEDYQEAAYDNASVERIAEQQLIATEFQMLSTQVLGLQNKAIIELLALQFQLPYSENVSESSE